MATDASSTPVNGYGSHGSFDQNSGYGTANMNIQSNYNSTPTASSSGGAPATSTGGTGDIPKDEVGWYFVEQYYTTLSRSPEKLYLFYNKRSQFVLGQEADKVAVCIGQKAINERIKELDFRDCKVRVTNVDSQASDSNIVIQVIGEISNQSQPHKKFTQTFVLAGQTNGYFVLNDMFRYIVEEEQAQEPEPEQTTADFQEPAQAAVSAPEPETLTSSQDPAAIEESASKVDKELEQKVLEPEHTEKEPAPPNKVNGTPVPEEMLQVSDAPAAAPVVEDEAPQPPVADVQSQTLEPEKPKDPEPSPVASPKKQTAQPTTSAAAAPAPAPAPSKPAAPKTWANLAAAAARVTPAVPAPQAASTTTPQQSKQAPAPVASPTAQSTPPPAPAASGSAAPEEAGSAKQEDEWTSVGDHKKQQSRAQAAPAAQAGPQNRGYIKNVTESLEDNDLRAAFEKYGEITYLDIHRLKNCAFIDFKTAEMYKAAVDANPHQVGNERLIVEERRPKPGMPFAPRGGARGGRGGQGQGRGGPFQGNRGNFTGGRGRGGNGASRGRGGAPAAA